jgi:uncharacterized protein YaeQ
MSAAYLARTRAREAQLQSAKTYAEKITLERSVAIWACKSEDSMKRSGIIRSKKVDEEEIELLAKDLARVRRMKLQELFEADERMYAEELDAMGMAFARDDVPV